MVGIEPLSHLTNLKVLDIVNQDFGFNIEPLKNLSGLIRLMLFFSILPEVDHLAGLVNLEELEIHGGDLIDLKGIAGLKKLRLLKLESYELTDLIPLSQLSALEHLESIECESLKDLFPLRQLSKLKYLLIADCDVLGDDETLTQLANCGVIISRH